MGQRDRDSDAIADWKFAALVMDRLCFCVFAAFIGLSTMLIFGFPYFRARYTFDVNTSE
jgi:hypothetical protein